MKIESLRVKNFRGYCGETTISFENLTAFVGRNDMIRESHTKEIAGNIPNAKLSIMKGDHFIANKRYITFNKEVEAFLQTIR